MSQAINWVGSLSVYFRYLMLGTECVVVKLHSSFVSLFLVHDENYIKNMVIT